MRSLALSAAALHFLLAATIAGAAEPPRLAVFDLELIDTSLEGEMAGADPAEQVRLRLVQAELRRSLEESGRFELVDTAPVADQVAVAGRLRSCNGCEVPIARSLDADLALVGWVHKVSNLILSVNVVIRNVSTREQVFGSSVDIRGNTDESWLHGIRYILNNRLLKQ
jgi:Protein of unknown function (DUF2380)